MPSPTATPPAKENLLLNLACNVAAPTLILTKAGKWFGLDPRAALIVALGFPLTYGIYDLIKRRNFNFIAALGFTSTLATGGLGLLKLGPFWFAVKEAVVPALIGLTVLASQWTKKPLVRTMLFNEQVIDVARVDGAIVAGGRQRDFGDLLRSSSWLLAASFGLSTVLNFVLARIIITAMPDTELFNEQLGRLTWMSYLVIMVPSMAMMLFALWRLLKGVQRLTGLSLEEIMPQPPERK